MLIISDTSVLIDIECGQLTKAMFRLPFQFAVPDTLFVEELSGKHGHLLEMGLQSKTMSGELVAEAINLYHQYHKISVNDMLAFTLAKHERSQLLTGDKALREVALKFNVEVHGTIWLVKRMLENGVIAMRDACKGFDLMRASGSRLPWDEIDRILQT